MKLPGDSNKQDKGVSHEMMQRSLQSQRRVVQRVGLLEDRVDQIESAEVEPGVDIGDLADGAKKIAKGIGRAAGKVGSSVGKSIGKNASLLADKAGKGLQSVGKSAADAAGKGLKSAGKAAAGAAGKAASATGKGIKEGIGKAGKGLTNVGSGISKFLKDKAKQAQALGKKKKKGKAKGKSEDTPSSTSGSENVKPPQRPNQPIDPLIPDPIAAQGKRADGSTIYDKNERARAFFEAQGKPVPERFQAPDQNVTDKITPLEDAGMDAESTEESIEKKLDDDFEIDPKMKKAFSDAMALPAKSAAVALIDLLEKIPAPSKEASKILNRNITKIANAFKLGAASTEVANDEEDNDKDDDDGKSPTLMQALIGKALNAFGGGETGGGETGGSGASPELPGSSPQQMLLPPQMGDPTTGKRAPYTGTADGIGLGDGAKGSRAMQPIKKRKGLAKKLFGMTPMGMAFNAGTKIFKGMKGLASKASGMKDKLKGAAGKALAASPVGMAMKFGMKALKGVKNIFNPPDEPSQNLTELTDKTIKETRAAKDAKIKKLSEGAEGTGDAAMSGLMSGGVSAGGQEGGELASPNIEESPFINAYNITSQF